MPISNPTLAEKLAFIEIVPVKKANPGAGDTWYDWDLSASIPAGALYAEILGYTDSVGGLMGVREKGTATGRTVLPMADEVPGPFTTKLDANRFVEVYGAAGTVQGYLCAGYWK